MTRESVPVLIGALIAVVAQIVLAPNIALFSAMPNFLVTYVLLIAMVRPGSGLYPLAFVLGLVSDLLGYGPVGAMPFLLLIASLAVSRAFAVMNNDTVFVPLVLFIVADFAVEMLYGGFLVGLGLAGSVGDAFLYRALPCALYESVCGLLLYPLAHRFLGQPSSASMDAVSPRLR